MVVRSTSGKPGRADGTGRSTLCTPCSRSARSRCRERAPGDRWCGGRGSTHTCPGSCNHAHNSPIAFRIHTITVPFDAQVKHPFACTALRDRYERAYGPRNRPLRHALTHSRRHRWDAVFAPSNKPVANRLAAVNWQEDRRECTVPSVIGAVRNLRSAKRPDAVTVTTTPARRCGDGPRHHRLSVAFRAATDAAGAGIYLGAGAGGWAWAEPQRSALVLGPSRSGRPRPWSSRTFCSPPGRWCPPPPNPTSWRPPTGPAGRRPGPALRPERQSQPPPGVTRVGWSPVNAALEWDTRS